VLGKLVELVSTSVRNVCRTRGFVNIPIQLSNPFCYAIDWHTSLSKTRADGFGEFLSPKIAVSSWVQYFSIGWEHLGDVTKFKKTQALEMQNQFHKLCLWSLKKQAKTPSSSFSGWISICQTNYLCRRLFDQKLYSVHFIPLYLTEILEQKIPLQLQ
jgi:hypothetical protein